MIPPPRQAFDNWWIGAARGIERAWRRRADDAKKLATARWSRRARYRARRRSL